MSSGRRPQARRATVFPKRVERPSRQRRIVRGQPGVRFIVGEPVVGQQGQRAGEAWYDLVDEQELLGNHQLTRAVGPEGKQMTIAYQVAYTVRTDP
jgi:hypothetical protein